MCQILILPKIVDITNTGIKIRSGKAKTLIEGQTYKGVRLDTVYDDAVKDSNLDGEILYVGGNGPGNISKIQDAINAADNGDTIWVKQGTYFVNSTINVEKKDRVNVPNVEIN